MNIDENEYMDLCNAEEVWNKVGCVVTRTTLNLYIRNGIIPGHIIDNKNYVDRKYVESCCLEMASYINVDFVINRFVAANKFPQEIINNAVRNIKNQVKEFFYCGASRFLAPFKRPLISRIYEEELINALDREKRFVFLDNLIPLSEAALIAELSEYRLRELSLQHHIVMECVKERNYVTKDSLMEFLNKRSMYIGTYDLFIEEFGSYKSSFDIENRVDRSMLNSHLSKSEIASRLITWKDSGFHGDRRNAFYLHVDDCGLVIAVIRNYLNQFGLVSEKWDILINSKYFEQNKNTKNILVDYLEIRPKNVVLKVAEAVKDSIYGDLLNADNNQVRELVKYTDGKGKSYGKSILEFLNYIKKHYQCNFSNDFSSQPTQNSHISEQDIEAYTEEVYDAGAHIIFDKDYIASNRMIDKALQNQKYAIIWIWAIWGYIASWRKEDLPLLRTDLLLGDRNKIRQKIINNDYGTEAEIISDRVQAEIDNAKLVPQKTRKKNKSSYLVIGISEQYKYAFGIAYTIVCLHLEGERIHSIPDNVEDYVYFFGEHYLVVFGNKPFKNKKSNKSIKREVVKSIEIVSDVAHKANGYRAASKGRAHINSNYYSLAESTSYYLPHALDGISENEIIQALFDAGVCSYIPFMLLGILFNKDYLSLPVIEQNKMIVSLNMSPDIINKSINYIDKAYVRAKKTLNIIIYEKDKKRKRKHVLDALIKILNGQAIGHSKLSCCALYAQGMDCNAQLRDNCIGCENNIPQKAYLFIIVEQISNTCMRINKAVTDYEKKRLDAYLKEYLLPSAHEILYVLKNVYNADMSKYDEQIRLILDGVKYE